MRAPDLAGSLLAALALGGCATSALDRVPATPTSGPVVLQANPQAAGATTPPPALDREHAYTLPELIDMAQSHNPATRVAWESARDAALAAGIAKAAYLPNLSASVVGAYQTSSGSSSVLGVRLPGDESVHGAISALSLQWLLFDFGERDASVAAAQHLSDAANITFTATHQQVVYQVSLAYYTHAAARARVDSAEKALRNAATVQDAAESRFSHGVGTVVDVAQAKQATAQRQLVLVQARGEDQDSYIALLAAMGIPPLTDMRIADPVHRKLSSAMQAPIQQIVTDALARRPDVLSAYATHEASIARLKAAQAEFLPKLFLSATGSYASTDLSVGTIPGLGQLPSTVNVGGSHWGATVLLGITVPLYDGGVRRALEYQARNDVDRSDATLQQVRDEATRQIVAAGNRVQTSLAGLDAADALASAAQVTFDAALDAYRHGVGSITDATRAETGLLESANAATDAYSAALISAATLALAVGTLGTAPD